MPVRSLRSSVMRWPGPADVIPAFETWAASLVSSDENVVAVGYFGSYARGNWGVGSDLDIVILLSESERPFASRVAPGDTTTLPVPVDVLTYTFDEWTALLSRADRFAKMLETEVRWVAGEPPKYADQGPRAPIGDRQS